MVDTIPATMQHVIDEMVPVTETISAQFTASYKVIGNSRIPISRAHGTVWRGRRDAGVSAMTESIEAWQEALRYYDHDQIMDRDNTGSPSHSQTTINARRMNDRFTETENVVFANISSLVPALYAKNPDIAVSTPTEQLDELAETSQDLLNRLFDKKSAPGLNIKALAKRCVVNTLLTNKAVIEIGYNFKEGSLADAQNDLARIATALTNAKTSKEIEELEGQLIAMEEVLEGASSEGPYAKFVSPLSFVVDPEAENVDLTDAKWVMTCEYYSVAYINARYGTKDTNGQYKSIYKPSHILCASDKQLNDEVVNNFRLFAADQTASKYGYVNDDDYKKAQRIKIWKIWDKVTRRVLWYADNDWTWPVWVWDDPYQLDTFYPFFIMAFHTGPNGHNSKGEVTYYLDQQDAINEINDELRRARLWARRNVLFDTNAITADDVEKFLKGADGTARGVNLPENKKMIDVVFTMPTPAVNFPQLFDTTSKFQAIDRIASVSDVLRGVQFKTNTTNRAIENYNASTNLRVDEKIDAIEDVLTDVAWAVLQLCLQFMTPQMVSELIGRDATQSWRTLTPNVIRTSIVLQIAAGSTSKPTSATKKREALELGQVLGQFVNAAPQVVTTILLQLYEEAFPEIVMNDEMWTMLQQAVGKEQQVSTGNAPQQGSGNTEDEAAQLTAQIQQLPPDAQQAIKDAIQQGVPPREAMKLVMEQMHGTASR